MISAKTWNKLLQELAKDGNVYRACTKVGIETSTYYRRRKNLPRFGERADEAISMGRMNVPDMAEIGLLGKIREGDPASIRYALSHLHPDYRPKPLPPRPKLQEEESRDESDIANEERQLLMRQMWETNEKIGEFAKELKAEGRLSEDQERRFRDITPMPGIVFVDFSKPDEEESPTEPPGSS